MAARMASQIPKNDCVVEGTTLEIEDGNNLGRPLETTDGNDDG